MNIKTSIKKIPNTDELVKRLLVYAKIDYFMNHDEEEYKVYHYDDKDWVKDGHYFRIDDMGGDHYHVLTSPVGSVIKGFGHETDMSPYNFEEGDLPELIKNHDFYHGMPEALFQLIDDEALEKDLVTFCVWQEAGQQQWNCAPIDLPDDWSDGSADFLAYVLDLQRYGIWFEGYYEEPIDQDVLNLLYNGVPATKGMIEKIPTEQDVEELLRDYAQNF